MGFKKFSNENNLSAKVSKGEISNIGQLLIIYLD